MGRIHARFLHPGTGQDPRLGRPRLPGNRQGSAGRRHHDSPQENKKPPHPDCSAEGAQPPGQLHPGARGTLHRKAQEIHAPGRPVRRGHRQVQLRVQRDYRAGEPAPALGQDRQGSAATGQVGDSH